MDIKGFPKTPLATNRSLLKNCDLFCSKVRENSIALGGWGTIIATGELNNLMQTTILPPSYV